ncbi:hypothetical protein GT204_19740 [Streptomyces sp. SID4919]|uniref:DUF6302 family protein n=1 Tax=unclassified Streptomyces TaxID=2593676 RepID=UPI000823B118|nr:MULTISPECIES: DUF6302 family protein [unclassified Streptomyces]MYY11081.1 hypothetical protein [Streptomyces sp. SID4919]SCK15170.1 hypothetical protein YW7DRAFT_00959 [Streptomyces sp. AmelKG-E11A]
MHTADEQHTLLASRLADRGLLEKAVEVTVLPGEGREGAPLTWLAVPVGDGRASGCLMVPAPLVLDVVMAMDDGSPGFPSLRLHRLAYPVGADGFHRIQWGKSLSADPETALTRFGYHQAAVTSLLTAGTTARPPDCRFPSCARRAQDGVSW